MQSKTIMLLFKGVVSVILLTYLVSVIDWQQVVELDTSALVTTALCVFTSLLLLMFMALRWSLLVTMQDGHKMPFGTAYQGYLIGGFFNIFMPGAIGGDLIRIKYCTDHCALNLKKSTLIAVTERLFGLTALALLFTIGLFYNKNLIPDLELNFYMVLLSGFFILAIIFTAKYWISKKIVITRKYFILLVLCSMTGQMADIITIGLLVDNFGYDIAITQLFFIMPLVYIATVMPLSLGGLGVREGVLSGLLVLFGVTLSDAVLISFMLYLVRVTIALIGIPFFLRNRSAKPELKTT